MTTTAAVFTPPSIRAGRRLTRFLRTGEARVGLSLVGAMLAVTFFGPVVAPYSPTQIGTGSPLAGPSAAHPLGTDQLGRDVLSQLLTGGGSVLLVPCVGVALSMLIGLAFGLVSGYSTGHSDALITRALDIVLSVPPLLIVLVIVAGFGTGNLVLVLSLVVVSSPQSARVIRGATRNLRNREFVDAAAMRGERLAWVLGREILPNMLGTISVEAAVRLTYSVLFIATLNFLGLGVQPPSPNWGLMVADGQNYIVNDPLMSLAPAAAIAMLVIGIHLVADALADAFGSATSQGLRHAR